MTYHGVTFRTASDLPYFEHPRCPCCDDILLVPDTAEYAGGGCIRHNWVCESCGHPFQTSVDIRDRFQSY
jgi:hypothetical protein